MYSNIFVFKSKEFAPSGKIISVQKATQM